MADKRILFVSQEITPYLPSSPLSELGRNLAQDAFNRKAEVRTFMPRFGQINERRNQLHEVIRLSGINISINDNDHPLILKVASMQPSRIQVYFIDNDDYFQKSASDVDPSGSNREDNDERAIFFARGTMETVKKLRWLPDVVVVVGWMSAVTALYLRRFFDSDKATKKTKIVYVITPEKLQAPLDPAILTKLRADGIPPREIKALGTVEPGTDLLHFIGMRASNAIVSMVPELPAAFTEYAETAKKPIMYFDPSKDNIDKITDFCLSLLPNK